MHGAVRKDESEGLAGAAEGSRAGSASEAAPRLPCRRHRLFRCRACGLHHALCVCAGLPRIALPFDVWLIQHAMENDRPTNTGRILHAMLARSRILLHGLRGQPFDPSALDAAPGGFRVLFPAEDAPVLSPADWMPDAGRRKVIVLLDGTWTQASHLRRRIAALRSAPCVQLPPGSPGRWRIRCSTDGVRLCTLEAGIRLIRAAGFRTEADRMDEAQDLIMNRMLYMKGRIPRRPPLPRGWKGTEPS